VLISAATSVSDFTFNKGTAPERAYYAYVNMANPK
jgi:hypothetical protein